MDWSIYKVSPYAISTGQFTNGLNSRLDYNIFDRERARYRLIVLIEQKTNQAGKVNKDTQSQRGCLLSTGVKGCGRWFITTGRVSVLIGGFPLCICRGICLTFGFTDSLSIHVDLSSERGRRREFSPLDSDRR